MKSAFGWVIASASGPISSRLNRSCKARNHASAISGSGRCSFSSPFHLASKASAFCRNRSGVPSAAGSPVNHRSAPISGNRLRTVGLTVSSCASMKLSRVWTSRVFIRVSQR